MKPIPNFPDYFADEQGNIFSMNSDGRFGSKRPTKARMLKPGKDRDGYFLVSLQRDGKQFTRRGHHLILETFVGPRPEEMEACHNDGNPANNRLDNLRWDTAKNNQHDKIAHGTNHGPRGGENGQSKLNEMQVRIAHRYCEMDTERGSQAYIAKAFHVTPQNIGSIVRRETWKHI